MILITRPRSEAVLLAKELMKTRYSSFIEPMTSFRYYKKKITYKKDTTYIVASLQTARALKQNKPCSQKLIKHGNFLVIGKKVTQSLKQLGCSHIVKTFKDSNDLISHLNKTSSSNIKLEYL